MTKDVGLHKALEQLERSVRKLDVVQAIAIIENEIAQAAPEYVPHFEVEKARLLYEAGQIDEAAQVLRRTAVHNDGIDSVHFFAGQYMLELGLHQQAIQHLTRCVEICESSHEHWYLDSAYLLRAYCAAHVGNRELARRDLAHLGDDADMSWLAVDPPVSKAAVSSML
ncbi:tetratricopeptide (TPR) repeat protein [Variovorax paradoxus]|uniref:hypothetical protein n=1 Tax=Variovorax paradoxus TaxID=34073 RepID=UPI0027939712|nr:hypothetical protein [Variovorax paradoxus]MDQ0568339.1 tetratricopeptide (TPR) repeat protein [Variovorax paradoxus]